MGQNLCRLPCKEASGGQALQRCSISRCQETCQTDICFGKITLAVSTCRLIFSLRYFFQGIIFDVCFAMPFSVFKIGKIFLIFSFWGLTFNS
jgi:hypothetical protein